MNPFWIKTDNHLRLAIVSRPRGGDWLEDEASALRSASVDILVSMLAADETAELGLAQEAHACEAAGIRFFSFPVLDRQVPDSDEDIAAFIEQIRVQADAGRAVAVHCRASIGRSSLLLAAILCTEGFSPSAAFTRISAARGLQVPDTAEQWLWVERFASKLDRGRGPDGRPRP